MELLLSAPSHEGSHGVIRRTLETEVLLFVGIREEIGGVDLGGKLILLHRFEILIFKS